jgi:transposase
MKRKAEKHTFYCDVCHSPCIIYKKGKKHRVLVCPRCGVLATNGLLTILGGALGSAVAPGVGTAIGSAIGTGAETLFSKKQKSPKITTEGAFYRQPRERKRSYLDYVISGV